MKKVLIVLLVVLVALGGLYWKWTTTKKPQPREILTTSESVAITQKAEAITVEGTVYVVRGEERKTIAEGDALRVGDILETELGGYVDIAYDEDQKNVTRLQSESKIKIRSVAPIALTMSYGDAFSKLKDLKESTFEVETPTALSSVRGSAYRTTHLEGVTNVYNFSPSPVSVFGKDEKGEVVESSETLLEDKQKTNISESNRHPSMPERMTEVEIQEGLQIQEVIGTKSQAQEVLVKIRMVAEGSQIWFRENYELWQDGGRKYKVHMINGVRVVPGVYDLVLPNKLTPYTHKNLSITSQAEQQFTISVPVGHVTVHYQKADGTLDEEDRCFMGRGPAGKGLYRNSDQRLPLTPGVYNVKGWRQKGDYEKVIFEVNVGEEKEILLKPKQQLP